jgi:hypothetical protein
MEEKHFTGLTARFKLDSVDHVNATVSLSASVGFWKQAAAALAASAGGYGAWQVVAAINEVVRQAEESFYHRIPEEKT